jgi:hypothetical protein
MIFGFMGNDVMGRRRNPHIEELHELYSQSSEIRVIKIKKNQMAEHVALMRENIIAKMAPVGKPEEETEGSEMKRRIILKWIVKKHDEKLRTTFVWLKIRRSGWPL